jgi:peptidoglycan/xylan/chitin deacetylase (PgdA/CDA1 family)
MNVRARMKRAVLSLDETAVDLFLGSTNEEGKLLSFLFHGLFKNNEERQGGESDPQQGITVEMFRRFVSHFRESGYTFISPPEIVERLGPSGKYILITFDDGYFNNVRAIPVLEEFNVPAVFFISTEHVKQAKSFWWDVVFREAKKRGKSDSEVHRILGRYKKLKTEVVETELRELFGRDALRPVSDIDRPFSEDELREISGHKLVFMGNHTRDHAILTNYSESEIRQQIRGAQADIREMTGQVPTMIAYPSGNYSVKIENAAFAAGLPLGVGVRPGRNHLPLEKPAAQTITLKRYTLWGNRGIEQQCRVSRSGVSFFRLLQGLTAPAPTAMSYWGVR